MRVSQRISANRRRRWRIWLIVAIIAVLAANTIWVDSRTRPTSPRDGGKIIDTGVGPVNVKVEGQGAAILLLHGFGAAINRWDNVAPALAAHHRVIRADLIRHGGPAAPRLATLPRNRLSLQPLCSTNSTSLTSRSSAIPWAARSRLLLPRATRNGLIA